MKKVYQKPEIEETIIEYSGMLLGSDIQGSASSGINPYQDYEDDIDL